MSENLKLHLGCGLTTPSGWVNVDGSWNARLARYPWAKRVLTAAKIIPAEQRSIAWSRNIYYHDLRKPLPWKEGVACAVYSSHLLEHLYTVQAMRLLQECFRVLEEGGVIRLMVPDLEVLAREYVVAMNEDSGTNGFPIWETPADRFLAQTRLRSRTAPSGSFIYQLYKVLMDLNSHKWMYDKVSLVGLVKKAGFSEVELAKRHISQIPNIHEVETHVGLIVEGVKRSQGSDQ